MGRKRNNDDEIEILRKEIRELKSLNRQLLKRLKKVDKGYKEIKEVEESFEEIIPKIDRCPYCEGIIKSTEFTLVNGKKKNIKRCQDCGKNQ
jgi:uncharacterized protein with PIN domain